MKNKKQKPNPAPLWITAIKKLDEEFVEVRAEFGPLGSEYYLTASFGIEAAKELSIGTKLLLSLG